MSNVLHNTPPKKLHQTLAMIYPLYYISMVLKNEKHYVGNKSQNHVKMLFN